MSQMKRSAPRSEITVIFTFVLSLAVVFASSLYGGYLYFKLESQSVTNFAGSTLGHRGTISNSNISENSFGILQFAHQNKLDGLEIDIQVCSDDRIVVFHDATIDRLAKKVLNSPTNMSNLISDLSFFQLRHYFSLPDGTHIPALSEFLVKMKSSSSTIKLMIEVKEYLKVDVVIKELVNLYKVYNFYDRVVVSSYNPLFLYRLKSRDQKIPIALLIKENLMSSWFGKHEQSKPSTVRSIHPILAKIVQYATPFTDMVLYYSKITWIPSFIGVDHVCFGKHVSPSIIKRFQDSGYQTCIWSGSDKSIPEKFKQYGTYFIKD